MRTTKAAASDEIQQLEGITSYLLNLYNSDKRPVLLCSYACICCLHVTCKEWRAASRPSNRGVGSAGRGQRALACGALWQRAARPTAAVRVPGDLELHVAHHQAAALRRLGFGFRVYRLGLATASVAGWQQAASFM